MIDELDTLRENLTNAQRTILTAIWNYHITNGGIKWMPAAAMKAKIPDVQSPSTVISKFHDETGNSVIRKSDNTGSGSVYFLTPLGALLTKNGKKIEDLVVNYLNFVVSEYNANTEMDKINADSVRKGISCDYPDSWELFCFLSMSSLSGRTFVIDANNWTLGLPIDLEELVDSENTRFFLYKQVLKEYNDMLKQKKPEQKEITEEGQPKENKGKFWFIQDSKLQEHLEHDIKEADNVLSHSAWKSSIIMFGSVLEGMLFGVLNDRKICNEQELNSAIKELNINGDLDRWELNELIKVAHKIKIIREAEKLSADILRNYRNYIHLGKLIREDNNITPQNAALAKHIVENSIEEISKYVKKVVK